MTTFPTLIPSSRTFTPGGYPHSAFAAMNAKASRVRNSNVMLESQLRLTFVGINESQMLSILTHYQARRGGFQSFPLPADAWSGVTAADFQLSGYGWVYAEPPIVEDLPCGGHIVELTLETVPPEGTALLGLNLMVRYSLAAGRAAAANGAALAIGYSLSGGRAGLPGLTQTVTYSINGGDATGGASVAGLDQFVVYIIKGGRAGLAGLARTVTYSLAGGEATGNVTDPDFANVQLLLHMDGSNGSTTFTDSSSAARTVTVSGNTQISTAQSKFGGASGYFDGTGDFLDVAGSSALSFPGAFSVQGWVRPEIVSSGYKTFCEIGTFSNGILIRVSTETVAATSYNVFVNNTNLGVINSAFTANTWAFISVTRNASNLVQVAVDGTVLQSGTISGTVNSSNGGLRIGRPLHTSGQEYKGWMDDFRITKGVARSHTPPTAAFPDS